LDGCKQTTENGQLTARSAKLIDNCMHVCLQLTANLAILINPFFALLPQKTELHDEVVNRMLEWDNAGKPALLSHCGAIACANHRYYLENRRYRDHRAIRKLKKSKKVEESKRTMQVPKRRLPVMKQAGQQQETDNRQPVTNNWETIKVKPNNFRRFCKIG